MFNKFPCICQKSQKKYTYSTQQRLSDVSSRLSQTAAVNNRPCSKLLYGVTSKQSKANIMTPELPYFEIIAVLQSYLPFTFRLMCTLWWLFLPVFSIHATDMPNIMHIQNVLVTGFVTFSFHEFSGGKKSKAQNFLISDDRQERFVQKLHNAS